LRSVFLDTLRLHVTGGRGGAGLPHYGGLGGAGGNVYFVAKENVTLKDVATKLKAEQIYADPGTDSSKRGIIGTPGQDKIISVPCGVGVYNENNILLGITHYHNVSCLYSVDLVDLCFFFTTFFLFFRFFD